MPYNIPFSGITSYPSFLLPEANQNNQFSEILHRTFVIPNYANPIRNLPYYTPVHQETITVRHLVILLELKCVCITHGANRVVFLLTIKVKYRITIPLQPTIKNVVPLTICTRITFYTGKLFEPSRCHLRGIFSEHTFLVSFVMGCSFRRSCSVSQHPSVGILLK